MHTEEFLDPEELSFDDGPDILAAMTLPELRCYVEEEGEDDDDLGLRMLLESPEALAMPLRR